jgi:hypothetical protein
LNGRELANSPRSASTFPLDRLSRSLSDLLNILTKLEQVGADFKSLTESIDTTSAAGRMMMQMLGSFAEFERAMLRERTKLGLARARAAGRKGGARSGLITDSEEPRCFCKSSGNQAELSKNDKRTKVRKAGPLDRQGEDHDRSVASSGEFLGPVDRIGCRLQHPQAGLAMKRHWRH